VEELVGEGLESGRGARSQQEEMGRVRKMKWVESAGRNGWSEQEEKVEPVSQ